MRKALVSIVIVMMTGCSTLPDTLQVQDEALLVSYPQVASNPTENSNKKARWGGVIAKIENQSDATLLEVVHYPLRTFGKPIASDESMGRFRVYVDGFLDPMVFEPGRSMTFVGQVTGIEEGSVGEHQYCFPTLRANDFHLWRDVQTVDVSTVHLWPYHHWYGFYHPFGYRHRVVISGSKRGTNSSKVRSHQQPSKPSQPKRSELERVMGQQKQP